MNKLTPQKGIDKGYTVLLGHITQIVHTARAKAMRDINLTQGHAYWVIGKIIIEHEQGGKARADYGQQTLIKLSRDLTERFGKGFSVDNLENMRRFCIGFPKLFRKSETVSRILSWSHYCELLKEDNEQARTFYEIEAAKESWSIRELKRQISSMLYERLALSRSKKRMLSLSKRGQVIENPEDSIKDPYVLEFLGLKENSSYTETHIEQALIDKLQMFLLEMGKGFSFVARQRRITIANRHYFIDLVFYNRILKCFVLVDIKRGEFDHADAGQMNFYLNYFRKNEMTPGENPPIGLILCSKKNEIFSKYVLGNVNNKIFASKYKLSLPSDKELQHLECFIE